MLASQKNDRLEIQSLKSTNDRIIYLPGTNPQYARLEQESRLLASQYSTASATSEKVYRKLCALEHDLSYLESDRQKLEHCLEQAKRLCQEMEGLNERASSELDSIRDVIRDYLDVPLGR